MTAPGAASNDLLPAAHPSNVTPPTPCNLAQILVYRLVTPHSHIYNQLIFSCGTTEYEAYGSHPGKTGPHRLLGFLALLWQRFFLPALHEPRKKPRRTAFLTSNWYHSGTPTKTGPDIPALWKALTPSIFSRSG
jgi:hypothetical protein